MEHHLEVTVLREMREREAKIKAWAPVEEPEPPYRPPTPDEEGVLEYVEAPPPLIDDDNTT